MTTQPQPGSAHLREAIKDCIEKLDRYCNRQGKIRAGALEMGADGVKHSTFINPNPNEGQHYPAVQSCIDRAKHALQKHFPEPPASSATPSGTPSDVEIVKGLMMPVVYGAIAVAAADRITALSAQVAELSKSVAWADRELARLQPRIAELERDKALVRDALGTARPLVKSVAGGEGSWAYRAQIAVGVIDGALITTDPDPEVRKIILGGTP